MLLSCPNCGTITEITDILIPSARLTATCSGCGGKIGGTVPARLDGAKPPGKSRAKKPAPARSSRPPGINRPPEVNKPARSSGPPEASRPTLGSVAKGLDPERLAGLVASDLLLYNREKIQESAAEGRLLSSMATEIVEAWEFYKKRVGGHTALGTSYFRAALNNVLSGGEPII
jgi:rRNA maturation protein Nop10